MRYGCHHGSLFNWKLLGDGGACGRSASGWGGVGSGEPNRDDVRAGVSAGGRGEMCGRGLLRLGQSVLLEWQQNSQNFVITDRG